MTTHDEQPENSSSEPAVEPKVEFTSIGRGSYSALNGGEDALKQFDKFIDPDAPTAPDIDLNFVKGDKVRADTMEYLKEKYLNGYSDKEEIIRKAREAGG